MILDWRTFTRQEHVKNLPLHQQKRLFEQEIRRTTEQNWFLESRIIAGAGASGTGGQVIDGPIEGALVTAKDPIGRVIEQVVTNKLGQFQFSGILDSNVTLTAVGGTDSITGVPYTGTLHGSVDYKTISPITTFAKYLKDERSITFDQAIEDTFKSSSGFFGTALDYANRDTILQKDFNAEALNGETEAVAALAVASFMEGACEIISAYEEGAAATTSNKDAAYLAMAKQMATFTQSINLEDCLNEVATDNTAVSLVSTKRTRTKTLLSNFKTDVFAVMDEQDKAPNYLVTKLNILNRSGKKFAETEVVNIKGAGDASTANNVNVTVSTKFNAESGSIEQIEEGVANKTVAESAGSYTPHILRILSVGPVGASIYGTTTKGTFHTVDDEIGVGTVLYANSNVIASEGATATSVTSTWNGSAIEMTSQFNFGNAVNMLNHLHSNHHAMLGDDINTIEFDGEGSPRAITSNKFYKLQGKRSGSLSAWTVTEVYEGNPRIEDISYNNEGKSLYMPVTQSYEFPPMDITIISASISGKVGFKVVTQEALGGEEEEEGEGIPEISFPLHNIKFCYTASTGTHIISGSTPRLIGGTNELFIQSNNHPDIKLSFDRSNQYQLYHRNRPLFNTTANGFYQYLHSNFINNPWNASQSGRQWKNVANSNQGVPQGGLINPVSGEFENACLSFSGSNLAEGIS